MGRVGEIREDGGTFWFPYVNHNVELTFEHLNTVDDLGLRSVLRVALEYNSLGAVPVVGAPMRARVDGRGR